MPSKGVYTAAPPRQGENRFYNPPEVRRQQMMQRQLVQQQRQQDQRQQEQQLQLQMQCRGRANVKAERDSSKAAVEADKPTGGDDSSTVAALPVPRSLSPASTFTITNLDRLMESVTPFIEARYSPEVYAKGFRSTEMDSHMFFQLEDLWESFSEWSFYGRGVPLLLNGRDPIEQYYVPFLSGIQLFIDPSKASTRISGPTQEINARLTRNADSSRSEGARSATSVSDLNMQQLSRLSIGDGAHSADSGAYKTDSPGLPLFQFLEGEQPYKRRPLADKISLLASKFPELSKCRSCDLLPSSWICVAWYPIYRIPVGPTLQDLDASFLTFHSLSTQPRSSSPAAQFHQANTRTVHGFLDPTARISLPVFALASYKLKGSIVSPCGPQECEQENSLLQAADDWLRCLQVMLPDYQFFRSHYFPR